MSDNPYIIDVTSANFEQKVLDQSNQLPVLVDFWAVWCGPCQMLTPILVKLANAYQGKLLIAKVNIDEQQELAVRFNVRSVPTLKLFRHGQAVAEIMGAQPENVLQRLIEPHIERPADKQRQEAMLLHLRGESEQAVTLLQQAINEEPTYYRSHEDLLTVLVESGRFKEAGALLDSLPPNVHGNPAIQAVLPKLAFGRITQNAPPAAELEQTLRTDGDDHQARYQLSAHQVQAGEYEAAMENLLAIMRKDRKFGDDAARKALVDIFNLLGDDPLVSRYRAKLSALLY